MPLAENDEFALLYVTNLGVEYPGHPKLDRVGIEILRHKGVASDGGPCPRGKFAVMSSLRNQPAALLL